MTSSQTAESTPSEGPRVKLEGSSPPSLSPLQNSTRTEGGYGWICVLCSFLVNFFALGIESTWGVYQEFYANSGVVGPISNSNLAWVGAIQAVGVSIVGFVAGILADKIGYRATGITGTTLLGLSLVTASFASKTWHLYLTQGIVFGVGSALAVVPALTIPSQWFTTRRGLVTGISVGGYGIGGLVLSPVTRVLINKVGFRWTLRAMGLLTSTISGLAFVFMKMPPKPPVETESKTMPMSSKNRLKGLFKDLAFLSLWLFMVLSAFGYYIPTFYSPEFASKILHEKAEIGATSVAVQAGLSALGRVAFGLLGDYIGHIPALALCQLVAGLAQMVVWPFVSSVAGLMGFSALYGFFSGGIVSLPPVVVAEIWGLDSLASITGILLTGNIPGTLVGTPIAGAILDRSTRSDGRPNFLPVQIYGGSWLLGGCIATVLVSVFRKRSARARLHV